MENVAGVAAVIPGLNVPASIIAAGAAVVQGNYVSAGVSVLGVIPFAAVLTKGVKAARVAEETFIAGKEVPTIVEGVYEFIGKSGKKYVGQTGRGGARFAEHIADKKLVAGTSVTITEVLGGKTQREIAEQLRIDALGGVGNLENKRNPIGLARKYLLPSE